MSLLLYPEPLVGLLVIVVWWDVVIATPFPVQYQAEQCHFNGVKHPRKTLFLREGYTPSISLLLCPEPIMGLQVVVVVWWT